MLKLPLISLVVLGCLSAPVRAADMVPPDMLARTVTEEVLGVLRSDRDLQSGNIAKATELIETKIAPHFEFASMTRLAMGRNWRQASTDQQKSLTREFRALLVRTYTTAFTQYRNQVIEYRPLKLAPDDSDVVVRSLVKQSAGQPVSVDYRMEKTDKGWKVYDVKIENISLIENYRGSFNTEIQRGGVDGLIRALAEKNKGAVAQGRGGGQ